MVENIFKSLLLITSVMLFGIVGADRVTVNVKEYDLSENYVPPANSNNLTYNDTLEIFMRAIYIGPSEAVRNHLHYIVKNLMDNSMRKNLRTCRNQTDGLWSGWFPFSFCRLMETVSRENLPARVLELGPKVLRGYKWVEARPSRSRRKRVHHDIKSFNRYEQLFVRFCIKNVPWKGGRLCNGSNGWYEHKTNEYWTDHEYPKHDVRYNDKNWQPNELIDQDHGSKQYLCRAARANAKKRNKIHNKVVSNINADHDAGWDTYTECEEVHDDGT